MALKLSVCIPIHDMYNWEYFLKRLESSLERQTFQNFETVITKEGKMAENTNAAIKLADGEIIKILYLDDFLWSDRALQNIVDNFTGGWLAQACVHTEDGNAFYNPHVPSWNPDVPNGKNTIGSPSVVAFLNDDPLLFDEHLSWLLDCELYGRLYKRYGEPAIVPSLDIAIGIHKGQTSNTMPDSKKQWEHAYLASSVYGVSN